MTFEEFITFTQKTLEKKLPHDIQLTRHQVLKLNNIRLEGIAFNRRDQNTAPTIYMNDYYTQFKNGRPHEDIILEIRSIYMANQDGPSISVEYLKDFGNVRSRVVYKIIHYASNAELLESIPHIPFLDLAIVFYLLIDQNSLGSTTTLIQNQHLELWKVSLEELYRLAQTNTPQLLPHMIRSIEAVLKEMLHTQLAPDIDFQDEEPDPELDPQMYVLTNSNGINGSSCILYEDVLKHFAEDIGSDLIILPSSLHEVLLLPRTDMMNLANYRQMVLDINESQVLKEDRLSNQIYQFSRSLGQILPVI